MTLKIAERWFESRAIDSGITLLWEPHVIELMRCNIWHIRGRTHDLFIDTGMGVASLREATRHLLDKPVVALATHTHGDHIGSHHEFDDCWVHYAESHCLQCAQHTSLMAEDYFGEHDMALLRASGYQVEPGPMLSALPHADFDLTRFHLPAAKVTRTLAAGDVVDLGNRVFEVLHLPGHSPGSIGLWEASSGTLFSGDALHDGPLLDQFDDANIADYINTMLRLRELPVNVVHGGHDRSFGRERMRELIDAYLRSKGAL